MFVRFFIINGSNAKATGYSGGNRNQATNANMYNIKNSIEQNTLDRCINQVFTDVGSSESYSQRTVLVNLPDVVTFQIEVDCVYEYSYCAYNIDTKKIGFGGSTYSACNATYDNGGGSSSGMRQSNELMFDFIISETERYGVPRDFTYTLSDAYYEPILKELIPYIEYEKLELFLRCTKLISANYENLRKYSPMLIMDYSEGLDLYTSLGKFVLSETPSNLIYSTMMFMQNDIVLEKNKDSLAKQLEWMRKFIVEISQYTNETLQ